MKNIVTKYTKEVLLDEKGIYIIKILNKPNYFYVGSTKSKDGFYRRWYQHIYNLRKNKHYSIFLQNIVNKYGINCIQFEIVEIISNYKILYEREQFWLDYYSKNYNILNYAPIVAANTLSITQEVKNKISKSLKGKYILSNSANAKVIYKYDTYGNFIKIYNCILELCIEIKSKNSNFRVINKPLFHKGFLFTRKPLSFQEIKYFQRFNSCKKYWCRKPIQQYDLNNNFIKEWASLEEASIFFKISSGALNQALKEKVKTCKNSIWKYLKYQNPWNDY